MSVAREASESPNHPQSPSLVSAGHSDRCPVCGARLAVDQRYCVECGTRRGAPRFSLASQTAAAASTASAPPPRVGAVQRFMRPSSGVSLLLGLLILLVALGIGVLIGHNGNAKPSNGKVSVVVNGGASSGSASAGTPTTGAATGGSAASGSTGSNAKATKKTAAKKASTKAAAATNPNAAAKGKAGTAAAAKTFSKSATKKSTVGGQCAAGTAGCSNGKQTGNLF